MPLCSAYPGPLSVLVMDNARIHHGEEILELADRFGEFTQAILSHSICQHHDEKHQVFALNIFRPTHLI
jgi:hypothetical protein